MDRTATKTIRTVERLIPRAPEELRGLRNASPFIDALLLAAAVVVAITWLTGCATYVHAVHDDPAVLCGGLDPTCGAIHQSRNVVEVAGRVARTCAIPTAGPTGVPVVLRDENGNELARTLVASDGSFELRGPELEDRSASGFRVEVDGSSVDLPGRADDSYTADVLLPCAGEGRALIAARVKTPASALALDARPQLGAPIPVVPISLSFASTRAASAAPGPNAPLAASWSAIRR